jgi:glutamyl/glutaminyl-tRNA synthetase
VLRLEELERQFNIDKISKSGAKFSLDKLEFLNSHHIRNNFSYISDEEKSTATGKWRKMLIEEMPKTLHRNIKNMTEKKMTKVMDMMKIRIRFHSDI